MRAEVEAARAWGVPRSVFLGRVVEPGEPEWTVSDRRFAMALLQDESRRHACGHSVIESFDPALSQDWVAAAHRCHACAAASKESELYSAMAHETPPTASLHGLSFVSERRSKGTA